MYYSGMMTNLDYYLLQRPVHPCKIITTAGVSGSFFDVIRGFIQSVNTMESTVLVPTLLKDISLDGVSWVPTLMVKCNYRQLFEIYCAIKKCKNHFTEMDIGDDDEVDNKTSQRSTKTKEMTKAPTPTPTNENPLLVYAIESGIGYLSSDYVIDYCQQLDQPKTVKVPDIPSPSPSTPTLSSSSTATSTGSNRKQKISLDSGNWSSRGSDSVDDDFDFDSTGNGINGSPTTTPTTTTTTTSGTLINCLIDSEDANETTNTTNNVHSQSNQQQPLTTLLRATSTNLRNLKALFNHLKEVADFVTQQYLEALQLI